MRVADSASTARARADTARSDRFAAALREARRRERQAVLDPAGARGPAAPPTALGARRAVAARKDDALVERREEPRPPPVQATALAQARASPAEASASQELRALVRALPPAIEAARVREGGTLALAFGSALAVELTAAPGGVEIVLRPHAELAHGAWLELPRIVAALRTRGVCVTGAAVLPRTLAKGARGRGLVDGARGLD